MKQKLLTLTLLLAGLAWPKAEAQETAIKTNVLYDATATANIGVETAIAPRWTIDASANLNAWRFGDGKQWRHWLIQPEARYWLCNTFAGHFFGAHLLGGQYNFGHLNFGHLNLLGSDLSMLKDHRYQGWFAGAGVAYGYAWILNRHWNIEAEIGLGWVYTRYDKFNCAGCGRKTEEGKTHNYVGPTKAAVNLVYVF